jgi:hypothetical protein
MVRTRKIETCRNLNLSAKCIVESTSTTTVTNCRNLQYSCKTCQCQGRGKARLLYRFAVSWNPWNKEVAKAERELPSNAVAYQSVPRSAIVLGAHAAIFPEKTSISMDPSLGSASNPTAYLPYMTRIAVSGAWHPSQ